MQINLNKLVEQFNSHLSDIMMLEELIDLNKAKDKEPDQKIWKTHEYLMMQLMSLRQSLDLPDDMNLNITLDEINMAARQLINMQIAKDKNTDFNDWEDVVEHLDHVRNNFHSLH